MESLLAMSMNKCHHHCELNNYSMCQIGITENKTSPNDDFHRSVDPSNHQRDDIKFFVDLYTSALHLRERMKEEKLIHPSYSAHFDNENHGHNSRSVFHNCFHSCETIEWLTKNNLCKTHDDAQKIFQVLENLKIIHQVCDLNEFECPISATSWNHVKYLFRFRLDDGTADQNRSFQQFALTYETYSSFFTLDKNQCRGVDLQEQTEQTMTSSSKEQPGILLKGDNLARMLAFRSGEKMANIGRIADDMIGYGLVRFDECNQENSCNCLGKFRSDDLHQYRLSSSHRLLPKQNLDLTTFFEYDAHDTRQALCLSPIVYDNMRISISSSSINSDDLTRKYSNSDDVDYSTKLTCSIDISRRKKSASLNSPANSDHRPTAEELERRELPWSWRSYSLKRDRRGYGLILQGQGPCYVERIDPYGSAYTSGIRINEYLYAVEGINVLRRSGKEVERLLSMFDKCTVYTIFNRDESINILTPPNELNRKENLFNSKQLSTSLGNHTQDSKSLLTTMNSNQLNHIVQDEQQMPYSSSLIDGVFSSKFYSNHKTKALTKHLPFFRFTSWSCSNTLK